MYSRLNEHLGIVNELIKSGSDINTRNEIKEEETRNDTIN